MVETVASADGTRIAFDRTGHGRPIVIVGGALDERATYTTLAEHLSRSFVVYNYDRRARGESGDADPEKYTVGLEVEDLRAVVEAVGEPCSVFADCTGGFLAVLAAAQGVPMEKLALYEPPYNHEERRDPPEGYFDRLKELVEADRKAEAVALFQREAVGLPLGFISQVEHHPSFPALQELARSLVYDAIISFDDEIPTELLKQITAPSLVLDGGNSPPWQQKVCEDIAGKLANARHLRVAGESHLFDQAVVAPHLVEFFSS